MSDTTDLTAISTRTVLIEPQLAISFPAQHRRKSISRGNAGMRSYLPTTGRRCENATLQNNFR